MLLYLTIFPLFKGFILTGWKERILRYHNQMGTSCASDGAVAAARAQ